MKTLKSLASLLALLVASAVSVLAAEGRENPVPVRTVPPSCPADLRGTAGLVMVKVTIDETGNVTAAEVVKTSNEGFDKAAIDALKKWKFKPAKQDGTPIALSVTIPVKFVAEG